MKRILISLLCGLVLPFIYAIIVGPLTLYIENDTINDLLGLPVRWPLMVLMRVVPFSALGEFPFRDEDETLRLTYLMICNLALYSALTYVLLWFVRKPKQTPSELPPQPPPFVSN